MPDYHHSWHHENEGRLVARIAELEQDVADLQAKLFEAYAKKRKWQGHFEAAKRQLRQRPDTEGEQDG